MTIIDAERPLRILEIGGDCLFALAAPAQTEFYWTGIRLRAFLTALRAWNVLSPLGLFANFAWRIVHLFHGVPVVTLDLGDSFGIGRHNFFLLDVSKVYFKRELPADRWHVFFSSSYRDLPSRRRRGKAKNRRRLLKLTPISYGLFYFPPDFRQEQKSSDVFFAGNADPNSTVRSDGLQELLALRDEVTRSTSPANACRCPSSSVACRRHGWRGRPPDMVGIARDITRRRSPAPCR